MTKLPLLILALSLSACGYNNSKTPSASSTSTSLGGVVLNESLQPAAIQILSTHCLSCHGTENKGGLSNITDPNSLVQQGLIVPGNPGASLLIQYVSDGEMPPTTPLASSDIATLKSWVQGTQVAGVPTGTGSLAQQVTTIFQNNCVACHGSAGDGGLSNITNLTSIVQQGYVVSGNPAGSPIFSQISAGKMPPSGSLSAADIQTVSSWISSGAPAN